MIAPLSLIMLTFLSPLLYASDTPTNDNKPSQKTAAISAIVNARNKQGRTALHALAYNQKLLDTEQVNNGIRTLVQYGAEVNAQESDNGWTPLHFCIAYQKTPETIQLLKSLGATTDIATTDKGNTPLITAMECGRVDCIEALLCNNTPKAQTQPDLKPSQQ